MNQRPSSSSAATPTVAEPVSIVESPMEQFDSSALSAVSPSVPGIPHEIEREVQLRLQSHPSLKFSRLHVHRCREGICVEGFLESNAEEIDLCEVVRGVHGVTGVINRVVSTQSGCNLPKKG